eukprot:SRR837773.23653.p2 GENE.SRR837773.23653~~SRR837773.23653.p2  ORF type:complete len:127 (-),score=16.48 SRR837773.23653:178-558(-)
MTTCLSGTMSKFHKGAHAEDDAPHEYSVNVVFQPATILPARASEVVESSTVKCEAFISFSNVNVDPVLQSTMVESSNKASVVHDPVFGQANVTPEMSVEGEPQETTFTSPEETLMLNTWYALAPTT